MITLIKLVQKSINTHLLRRPTPIPYFHPLFMIYRILPLRGRQIEFTPPTLKRGVRTMFRQLSH